MVDHSIPLTELLNLLQRDGFLDVADFERIKILLDMFPGLALAHGATYPVEIENSTIKQIRSDMPLIMMAIINDFIPWSIVELFLEKGADIGAPYNLVTVTPYCINNITEINIFDDFYGEDDISPFIVEKTITDRWELQQDLSVCLPILASKYRLLKQYLATF